MKTRIAIQFREYNILICDDKIEKFPLKQNCIHNVISDNVQLIIQKVFAEENYLLRINCVKSVEVNDNRYFLWIQWFNTIDMICRIITGKSNEVNGCGDNDNRI